MKHSSLRAGLRVRVVTALSAALVASGLACSSSTSTPTASDETCSGAAPFAKPGPNAAGVTTMTFDGLPVEVWYPAAVGSEVGKSHDVYDVRSWLSATDRAKIPDADAPLFETPAYRDLPVAGGRYPLVLFSHGLGGYRSQSSVIMARLASWGFVVAAPDHLSRGLAIVLQGDTSKIEDNAAEQLRATLVAMKGEDSNPVSRFSGRIDTLHVAATAHSQGGAAVSTIVTDADITAWVLLASPGFGEGPAGKPLLMMGGTADAFAKLGAMNTSYDRQPAGKRYVQLKDGVHLAFTDICAIGKGKGGALGIAKSHGIDVPDLALQLITDGCVQTPLSVEDSWPIIGHYVTAELRSALGVDSAPRGLDVAAAKCFGDRIATFEDK